MIAGLKVKVKSSKHHESKKYIFWQYIATTAHTGHEVFRALFERGSLWCIVVGIARAMVSGGVSCLGRDGSGAGEFTGRRVDLGDDHSDADEIDFGALNQVKSHWRGIGVTLFVNWLVKAIFRWLCSAGFLFAMCLQTVFACRSIGQLYCGVDFTRGGAVYRDGVCRSRLTNGEPVHALASGAERHHHDFCLAPIVGLLLGLSAITVPWDTLLISVVLYIVIPVILAQILRRSLLKKRTGGV